jgi:pimeloyl-ACP methyl ester carboxylesterase
MGTAVLVHGAWSSPADWRWVASRLHARGIQTAIPDLPSHRERSADRPADVREVQAAIATADPPVAVVGWSYGGAVISDLTDTSRVDRLIYLGSYPEPVDTASSGEPLDPDSMPWLLFPDDATAVLDTDWWLGTPEIAAWPDEVVSHLREHRRRPITRSAWLPGPAGEAWRNVPTTITIGRSDIFVPAEQQEQLRTQFSDVRIVDGDHFLLFLQPDVVTEIIAETFATVNRRNRVPR